MLDPFPDKPKGMWWKTYQRLMEQYVHYDGISLSLLTERLDRFKQRSETARFVR
jgi:hypothetical protein